MPIDDVLPWLQSCKCQQFNCGHLQAGVEIQRLRNLQSIGDALVGALKMGMFATAEHLLKDWDEVRNG